MEQEDLTQARGASPTETPRACVSGDHDMSEVRVPASLPVSIESLLSVERGRGLGMSNLAFSIEFCVACACYRSIGTVRSMRNG